MGRAARLAHYRRWMAAALRMSLAVRGELGFKASRSIRRLLGKQTGSVLEPSRSWGRMALYPKAGHKQHRPGLSWQKARCPLTQWWRRGWHHSPGDRWDQGPEAGAGTRQQVGSTVRLRKPGLPPRVFMLAQAIGDWRAPWQCSGDAQVQSVSGWAPPCGLTCPRTGVLTPCHKECLDQRAGRDWRRGEDHA